MALRLLALARVGRWRTSRSNYNLVVDLGISSPLSLVAPGAPPPQIHWVKALADTGCTHTSIFSGPANAVGLSVVIQTSVQSTTQAVTADVYVADLFIRWSLLGRVFEFPFRDRRLLQLIRPNPAFEALLGMDILGIGIFVVNGQTGSASFCW